MPTSNFHFLLSVLGVNVLFLLQCLHATSPPVSPPEDLPPVHVPSPAPPPCGSADSSFDSDEASSFVDSMSTQFNVNVPPRIPAGKKAAEFTIRKVRVWVACSDDQWILSNQDFHIKIQDMYSRLLFDLQTKELLY